MSDDAGKRREDYELIGNVAAQIANPEAATVAVGEAMAAAQSQDVEVATLLPSFSSYVQQVAAAPEDKQVEKAIESRPFLGPDQPTSNRLWTVLVAGVVGALVLGLVFIFVLLLEGQDPALMLTAFTALLTGALGLFTPTPAGLAGASKAPK